MKKLIFGLILLMTIARVGIAKDPFPVADNVECYAIQSSTEASIEALAARSSRTYRIKWELLDITGGTGDLYWYDVAFTTNTIETATVISTTTATTRAYKVNAVLGSGRSMYRDDFPCYQGAIHVMSLTTPTTFYILEWWR